MHLDKLTLIYFGCLIVAVILHEISHGVVALWFGDRTAKEAGRLTLNPVPHIDPFGSILMPALGALTGIPVIAWAKPVPVNPMRMRNPRRDLVFVSLAGPASNLILMTISALAARQLYLSSAPNVRFYEDLPLGILILFSFAVVNMFLAVFNLLPIPPLDGSALIERVLPREWLPQWYKFRPYGFLVLFVLVFSTGIISKLLDPLFNQLFDFVFG
ncbi:MAG: site-2 protease family protein [Acidimicrobiia bacterium]